MLVTLIRVYGLKFPMGGGRDCEKINGNGDKLKSLRNVKWYTNLSHSHLPRGFRLDKTYSPENYPKYDNYDAIEVSQYKDIPQDYNGLMGVPISFMNHFNPKQFELVGFLPTPIINSWESNPYKRVIIKAIPGFKPPEPPSKNVIEQKKRDTTLRKKFAFKLYEQQSGKCNNAECIYNEIQQTIPIDFMDIDHKVPISKGGGNEFDNLQLLCRKCNGKKSNKTTNRSSMPLLQQGGGT